MALRSVHAAVVHGVLSDPALGECLYDINGFTLTIGVLSAGTEDF